MGNIIFDHGRSVGVKKWRREDLKQPGDYWYSGADWQVRLYSERNPADDSPEHRTGAAAAYRGPVQRESCRLRRPRARLRGRARVRRRDHAPHRHPRLRRLLDRRRASAHACPTANPVRFGNGIEFWENAARQPRRRLPHLGNLRRRADQPGRSGQFTGQHHLSRQCDLERGILVRVLEPRTRIDHAGRAL